MAECRDRKELEINTMTIGEIIRSHRKKLGMSQSTLAKRVGIQQTQLSGYETDSHVPSLFCAECIADVFGITLDELVGRKV